MRDPAKYLKAALEESATTLASLRNLEERLLQVADVIGKCLTSGGKLLVCGNGGSAADAAHFTTEFVVRFASDRPAYPAICLNADGTLLTAAGNDYGFQEVFARQIAAFGQTGDVLVCLTTSGHSANIQSAINEASRRGLSTVALLGRDGGITRGMADMELLVSSESPARIQEAHMFLLHVLCEIIEERLKSVGRS